MSNDMKILEISKYAEIIDNFISFDLNQKHILSKMLSAFEHEALDAELYQQTQRLLQDIELLTDKIAFSYSCDIQCSKLTIGAVLKAIGIEIRDEYSNLLERLVDYMELVREFDREKLFITVNLRSFFPDEDVLQFMKTVHSHSFHVIMLECCDYPRLPTECRVLLLTACFLLL